MAGYYDIPSSVCPSTCPSTLHFKISPSFHHDQIAVKLGGQLDHGLVQHILFCNYSTSNFDRVITLFNDFSDLTLFLGYSSYSFHLMGINMVDSKTIR